MAHIRLLHWKRQEAAGHLALLRKAGHRVDYQETFESQLMSVWRSQPPDAFLIDLSRLPSHGREIAVALRSSPATRKIPLVFCGGDPAKVQKIRSELPDAGYCVLSDLAPVLQNMLEHLPEHPVRPMQIMERYGTRSAAQKLGIRENALVAMWDAPPDYRVVLGPLPDGVGLRELDEQDLDSGHPEAAVTLCFAASPDLLRRRLSYLRAHAAHTKLWVLWKKGKVQGSGVSEQLVRETGIDLGLVDYKICAVDAVWSGLLFARKVKR